MELPVGDEAEQVPERAYRGRSRMRCTVHLRVEGDCCRTAATRGPAGLAGKVDQAAWSRILLAMGFLL